MNEEIIKMHAMFYILAGLVAIEHAPIWIAAILFIIGGIYFMVLVWEIIQVFKKFSKEVGFKRALAMLYLRHNYSKPKEPKQ